MNELQRTYAKIPGNAPKQEVRKPTRPEALLVALGAVTQQALSTGIRRSWDEVAATLAEHRENHFKDTPKITDGPPITTYKEAKVLGTQRVREEVKMANSIPLGRVLRRGLRGFSMGILEGAALETGNQIGNAASKMVERVSPRRQ